MSGYGFTSTGTAYDDEDRLTGYQRAATSGSALLAQSWALTSVGDWSSVTTNGTAVTRTHGPTHELLTSGGQSVTTDVKGNQTVLPSSLTTQSSPLALTWDYDNKLKSSDIDNNGSADVTFEYDALGRRVARTEGSNAEVYFQADQQTIADYPRGGAASTATYRYVFASYIDEPVVRKTTGTSGTVLYFHRNQQYSILALTDSSGNVSERYAYTAYGQPTFLNASATVQTSSPANNRYAYTAREWDSTLGLHHFRARWMSGITGRFLTRDPIGFKGGIGLYCYVNDRPFDYLDPLGLDPWRHIEHKKSCYGTGVIHTVKCGELNPAVSVGFEYAISHGISIGIIPDWIGVDFSSQFNKTVGSSLNEVDKTCCIGTLKTVREFKVCLEWDEVSIDSHWEWLTQRVCLPDPLLGSRCYDVSIPNFVLGFRFTANRTISFETPIISETGTSCNCPAK